MVLVSRLGKVSARGQELGNMDEGWIQRGTVQETGSKYSGKAKFSLWGHL